MNRSSTRRTYSQSQDADWEHFMQTESDSTVCDAFAEFQDSSPVKSPMRKKSFFILHFHMSHNPLVLGGQEEQLTV